MIIEWFMGAAAWVIHPIFAIMPDFTVPAWFTGATVAIGSLFSNAASMGVWIPIALAVNVAGALFTAMMGGAIIKLLRIVASFLTAGGGSAA